MAAKINNALLNEVLWLVEALGFENFAEFGKSQGDADWTAMGLWEANGMAIAQNWEWEEVEAVVDHLWVD